MGREVQCKRKWWDETSWKNLMTFQYFKKVEAFPNLNTSVLSLELCSPTKCQAQKQNQKVEFNTIKIEELYFQEV